MFVETIITISEGAVSICFFIELRFIANHLEAYYIKSTAGLQDALKGLTDTTIQEMHEVELDEELGYVKGEKAEFAKSNYRNGHKPKTVKSKMGELKIEVPQDRNSDFEPKVVPKHKRDISEIEQKIINMNARGLTTREISEQITDIYGFDRSAQLVSKVTEQILPQIEEWQNRQLVDI